MLGTVIQRSLGATDQTSRSVVASSELAGSMFRCLGVQQKMKGYAKTRVAGVQRRTGLYVARRDVVQHDNVGGNFLITER